MAETRERKIAEHKIHARVWDAVREVWWHEREERLEIDKLPMHIRDQVREISEDITTLSTPREPEAWKWGCWDCEDGGVADYKPTHCKTCLNELDEEPTPLGPLYRSPPTDEDGPEGGGGWG